MLDREKVVTVLQRRFPGMPVDAVAAAANAIVGLEDEWDEVTNFDPDLIACLTRTCDRLRKSLPHARAAAEFRVFRKRSLPAR